MVNRIEKDRSRFRQILRGQIKKELRKYISRGELIGKQGKDIVSSCSYLHPPLREF